jgi:ribosomal protein S18 acetylase RimI-like enzyme
MIIKEITEATPQVHTAIEQLLTQLTKKSVLFSMNDFQEIVKASSSILLGAFENNMLIGMLTLALIKIPVGMQCRIEDVVVDKTQRGKGIGEALTIRALKIAENIGVKKVSLSSNPNRVAANKLYQKLGFKLRETNSYLYEVGS